MLPTAADLLAALRSGEICARDLVRDSLTAIEASQPTVNAYTHVDAESALKRAASIDEDRAAGKTMPPLAGLPVAVKDVLCTCDMPTTCSSNMLRDFTPPYDAHVVSQLRAAGAIIVGKTNMDEFAMGSSTETSAMGATRNPWNLDRSPGGSSGGAAAAVAAGTVPLSIGTDTGGSIRQPAAFCGVTGLKPTYGRVSRYGLIAFASSLDQAGPMGWSVADVAIGLQTLAGFDARDSTSVEIDVPDFFGATKSTDLRGIKIGVLTQSARGEGVDPSVRKALSDAQSVLADQGAEIMEIELTHSQYWVPTYYVIAPSEASSNLSRFDGAHYGLRVRNGDSSTAANEDGPLETMYRMTREAGFGSEVKRRIMVGTYALSEGYVDAYYNQALKARRLIREDFDAAFSQVDVLLGPTTPTSAFSLGSGQDDPISLYLADLFTVGANLAGIPALSIPAGHDASGLPVGVQLQAPVMREDRLLFIGNAFQSVTDHHLQRPKTAVSGAA
ncbi:MAG: Asp-tRNA(Asn)/Glu-tRNA(Gln) amidotransferase subunit GatA [Planctomycetota bacterium]